MRTPHLLLISEITKNKHLFTNNTRELTNQMQVFAKNTMEQ